MLQELRHGLRIFKRLIKVIKVHRLKSVLIFSILNHPCYFIVHLFGVFYLSKRLFSVGFVQMILSVAKVTQITATKRFLVTGYYGL